MQESSEVMFKRKLWTDKEVSILKKIYPDEYAKDIAIKLCRNIRSIYGQAKKLNLKKSESFLKMELEKQGERLKICGVKHRKQKGCIPPNKGIKMSPEIYDRIKHTFFQKGIVPHNTRPIGAQSITKDGYMIIKIGNRNFVHRHVQIWEEKNGPVPKGFVLMFIDGNKRNICIENLELISQKENMVRNSIARFPPELISVIRLNNKLLKEINKIDEK